MFSNRSFCVKACLALGLATASAAACPPTVTLSGYQLIATYSLPVATLAEASGITWNWETNSLFIVPDTGVAVVEVSTSGVVLSSMSMINFADTEAITYMGGGKFVVAEERLGRGYQFTYVAGGTLNRNTLPSIAIGPNTGTNSGSEGLAWDPRDGSFISTKEKSPENAFRVVGSFSTGASTYSDLFPVAPLAVDDLADVCVLASVPALLTSVDRDNLLLLSQASNRLLKTTRSGQVLGSLNLAGLGTNPEGVTMDQAQRIYICADSLTPQLFVFAPPVSDTCPCSADLDRNGGVDGADLGGMLAKWGPVSPGEPADLNGSGAVDGADLGALLAAWGNCL